MNITIIQMHGCNKCFNETLLLKPNSGDKITRIAEYSQWKTEKADIVVITGYLIESDQELLCKIQATATKVIAYGSCAASGGIFGLSTRNGNKITPLKKIAQNIVEVHGCLGEIEELQEAIEEKPFSHSKKLCEICSRRSTCNYLDDVVRQINLEDNTEACLNDLGWMCTGYIARECKENCVKAGAPCRGCKPKIEMAGFRMLGMFGTLMGNIEVATEATGKGGTDKLADKDDDITDKVRDITGNFFRFELANTVLPIGKVPSNGSLIKDIFIGRLIEELPLLLGMMGGNHAISYTLAAIEALEEGIGLIPSEKTKIFRAKLLRLESDLNAAVEASDSTKYLLTTNEIRKIAGNMNLSNLFYGGFKTPIEGEDNYADYKYAIFEWKAGTYKHGPIQYEIDANGKIINFTLEGVN